METIREWAEYYQNLHLWVYPCSIMEDQWSFWRNRKEQEYVALSKEYPWESETTAIKVVAGKKGIRVLQVKKKGSEEETQSYILQILFYLGLPTDYSWIIEKRDAIAFIVDTPGTIKNVGNRSYKNCFLLWEGTYSIPSSIDDNCHFYDGVIPDTRPAQISNDALFTCLNILVKQEEDSLKPMKQNNKHFWKSKWFTIVMVSILALCCLILGYWLGHTNAWKKAKDYYNRDTVSLNLFGYSREHFFVESIIQSYSNHVFNLYHSSSRCHNIKGPIDMDVAIVDSVDRQQYSLFCNNCMSAEDIERCKEFLENDFK